MERVVNSFGANSAGGVGSPAGGFRTFPDEAKLYDTARNLGRELCRCIAEGRAFPEQDAYIHGLKGYMSGLVDVMKEEWVFERKYWDTKRPK